MSDKELQQQMDAMRALDEPMPQVGIFWYDPQEHSFLCTEKKEITPKMVEESRARGEQSITYATSGTRPQRESGERVLLFGRVAWNINKFIVFVGQWAKPIEAELAEMIEKEFALPYFEFVYDIHWDLGHGWSGDL